MFLFSFNNFNRFSCWICALCDGFVYWLGLCTGSTLYDAHVKPKLSNLNVCINLDK